MKVKSESEVAQSCLTLSDPMNHSTPGPSVHGIFQARVLEWGAISLYRWTKHLGCYISVSVLHTCMYLTLYVCLSTHTHTHTHIHTKKLSNIQYSIVNCGFSASLVVQMVKNLLKMLEMWVQFMGWEDPLGQGMATYSSILAWRIPWTEEPCGPQSMGLGRVGHD